MAQRTMTTTLARRHPLLVTNDPELLDQLLDIAARCGVDLDVVPDPTAARPRYPAAPLVLVGAGIADDCARANLPRRPGVVVIGREESVDPPWSAAEAIGAEHVALLPTAAGWLADRMTDAAGPAASAGGRVITVIGGRGGAGASVLAAGLAVTGARSGLRALLVDADPLGGGVDLVLGWEGLDGVRWPALADTSGSVSPPALTEALPRRGELSVLSWDRGEPLEVSADAMIAALDAGRRGSQLIVVDLPRRLDDAATLALAASDLALMIVPAELRACAAAARVASRVSQHTNALSLVVRGPAPGRLKPREIARALGVTSIGTLRSEHDLARGLEHGQPPAGRGRGSLACLCQRVLAELGLADKAAA
ncbi:MAG: septum site-determining protein minD [Dactylosporangium sp.]|nr:CpaE-like family protein [Dactylosporangium sp.]NNJ63031.1 septum site-determining protein minD [Dactylosporangium sp.]